MSKQFLTINEGELIPLHTVRRVTPVTSRDLQSLSELSDKIDLTKFNTKVDIAKRGEFYASQTLADFKDQGVNFVQASDKAYVPTENILKARDLNEDDRTSFKQSTSRNMHKSYKSRIETVAGSVLSDVSALEVMGRLNKPFFPPEQKPIEFKPPQKTQELSPER